MVLPLHQRARLMETLRTLSYNVRTNPNIESLALDFLEVVTSDSQSTMELTSHTLKSLFAKSVGVDKIILDADNLEVLNLNALNLDLFELIGKGTLKHLKIDDVSVTHMDIGESTDHLEVVDVSNFTIVRPKLYSMISRASNLRMLRFWGVSLMMRMRLWTQKPLLFHFLF
ncbi:hypothetical protein GUJ93_ZPchr0483g7167 [Zizania palustris]|uniref:Uncharacterized protein n=1 Tax=Zizania palustris TaxID=103762 RepID=A0A8J5R1X2_ZIZPA|nr:hypothetical protein GUJ93_ZPchr0483g7167 [Zizania palustris]